MRAIVIGGGLAGLAAALELQGEGHDVTVLEARPDVGGAVQTLPERAGDPPPPPDNGQHIALGCCTEYLRFLEEIGSVPSIRREPLSLPVIDERGKTATIGAGALALLRYRHVSLGDRLAVARATLRMRGLAPADHEDETFGELLRRLGCSTHAVDRFWDVFIRPALNLRCDEAAASLGIFTVQTALLGPRSASDLLLPTAPLGAMHGEAAARLLAARGATIRTGARAVDVAADGCNVVLADGEEVEADAIVLAVPPDESALLLGEPPPALEDSPIVSVHLLFDRTILPHALAALLGSPAHWIFDRGALTGRPPPGGGQYLTVVSSGAPELLELRGRALVDVMAREVTDRLGRAELLWSRVSREPRATFACRPGSARLRPGPDTARRNVTRAGAWTDTGWPATMESAVRSGRAAARRIVVMQAARAVPR
jgi:squalene-associated FAD-dependent desaturase